MRPFGLPADQAAELRTSRHGELLFYRDDQNAPTCTDCHDSHTIRPPEDARSDVHPLNIMGTCVACHDNEEMMAGYELPTGQGEIYRASAHGIGLYEHFNFAAPTCISCHGSHSALPASRDPGGRRLQSVPRPGGTGLLRRTARASGACGADARLPGLPQQSWHGARARRGDRSPCAGAVTRTRTAMPPPWAPTSRPSSCGRRVTSTPQRKRSKSSAAAGRDTEDARFRHPAPPSRTFGRMGPAQHSLDVEALEDQGRRVRSVSANIREPGGGGRGAALGAHAAARTRHGSSRSPPSSSPTCGFVSRRAKPRDG